MQESSRSRTLLECAATAEVPTILGLLGTSPRGLSNAEAAQRLARYGPNEVEPERRSLSAIVREQVTNGINLLLAFAGVLTFLVGDPVDGAIIVALLGLNVGLSIVQEYRAERALEGLRSLLPLQARVWRDGIDVVRPARELVPGDLVLVHSGNIVPADLPMLAIVTDRVSVEDIAGPRHWDVRRLVELAIYLGLTNALFAFGLLRVLDGQPQVVVHTAWFLLLGTTALLIMFVVRAPGWFWRTPPPSRAVALAIGAGLAVTVGIVNLPAARDLLGLAPLPWTVQLGILGYSLVYLLTADLVKLAFHRTSVHHRRHR